MIMNHFNMFDTLFKGEKKRKIREAFIFLKKGLRNLELNKEFINI